MCSVFGAFSAAFAKLLWLLVCFLFCMQSCSYLLLAVFAFLAEAGPHLPTPDGWKAELA